jgi:hypothetical protein
VTAAAAKEEGALSEAFAHMMDGIHAISHVNSIFVLEQIHQNTKLLVNRLGLTSMHNLTACDHIGASFP